jgi:hypothetical protein
MNWGWGSDRDKRNSNGKWQRSNGKWNFFFTFAICYLPFEI